ncbi:SCO2583/SCO2584 N-terminal domain-containing protein [Streptomyces thermodiastaticus]|uniref:SCO2583/SCO2584 N-terminal domain-containing protein n=1 Tax=Streptomyces thermodiastaticus TaxID=44061 RepID=UPI00167B3206|nr:hypothetical protein [Streptomyces thermodiastaticus]MCE7548593.1 hypothetical protein [Streptomyces thermodiastaticus]GHF81746.1 hypothetical protein GCM10018787_33170 [Streptomyces thermodiastaticus]
MTERDEFEQEFDLQWANAAVHKEPSARARMLAARRQEESPAPRSFAGAEPAVPRRSSWRSAAIVFGGIAALIVLLGYARTRALY